MTKKCLYQEYILKYVLVYHMYIYIIFVNNKYADYEPN